MMKQEQQFIKTVKDHYRRHGRRSFPWRQTRDPYRILVSEMMLQQTQADRVLKKYEAFLEKFPTVEALAAASLGAVLREWQGLGYNRRTKMLHDCAQTVVHTYGGKFPREHTLLMKLPGIGPYTAGAVMAFAFNKSIPIIETNIRSAYLHHFFNNDTDVSDTELMVLIERTLDTKHPREWYAALMDYGSYIKKTFGNPNSKSKHYIKQTSFKGSDREIRGAIIRTLSLEPASRDQLLSAVACMDVRFDAQIERLLSEGMIKYRDDIYFLP